MRTRSTWLCQFCLALCAVSSATAARWQPGQFQPLRTRHVSTFGSDDNDGLSEDRPLRTISKAAQTVKPGDLVLVRGGVYVEHVHLKTPGTKEHPIVLRATPNETVVVTFGRTPTGWRRIEGSRFGYVVRSETIPCYVMEERTFTRYAEVRDLPTLDAMPGSFIYDEDARTLAVHAMRSLHPDAAAIVCIDYSAHSGIGAPPGKRGYAYDKGIWPWAAHNRVEGFHLTAQPLGVQLRADNTEVWNCTAYGCALSGITAYAGKGCIIANNESYLNGRCGVHVSSAAQGVRALGNTLWHNRPRGPFRYSDSGGHPHNLALYGAVADPTVLGNTIVSDRNYRVLRYKNATGAVVMNDNVIVGGHGRVTWGTTSAEYSNNTVVGGKLRSRVAPYDYITPEDAKNHANAVVRDSLYLPNMADAGKAGFADAARHDYRLLADSPHLGTGAHPKPATVRFVATDGDDARDGRTPKTAWRTLAKAADAAQPGETVYVMPGTYAEAVAVSLKGTADAPIEFKTHGRGEVAIEGRGHGEPGVAFVGAAHVALHGFVFRNSPGPALSVRNSEDVTLVENVFDNGHVILAGSQNVTVENNTFYRGGQAIVAEGARGALIVRNNLFAELNARPVTLDETSARVLISERNAFAGAAADEQLAAWQAQVREAHLSLSSKVAIAAPDYMLPTHHRLGFAGLGHKPIGARGSRPDTTPVAVEHFAAVYADPTSVVISWTTPHAYPDALVTCSARGQRTQRVRVQQDRFDSMLKSTTLEARFAKLTPGTTYTVALAVDDRKGREGTKTLTFATPRSVREPVTLYVGPHGSDGNDGRTRAHALRTLRAAGFAARPGDTVLVAAGVYPETLTVWCGGLSEDKHLTFRGEQPGQAVIDLGEIRSHGVVLRDTKHVTIDGFHLRGFLYSAIRKAVLLSNVEDVQIVNNSFESPRAEGRCGCILIGGNNAHNLVVRDNILPQGFQTFQLWNSGDVTLDHNTFYRAGVTAVQLHGPADAAWRITNNIFMDVTSTNKVNAAVMIERPSKHIVCDHNLYWRTERAPKMGVFGFRQTRDGKYLRGDAADAKTVEQLRAKFDLGAHGRFGDPKFAEPERDDYRLQPGSAALGMASDGGAVGARIPSIRK